MGFAPGCFAASDQVSAISRKELISGLPLFTGAEMFKNILCPIDFSEFTKPQLDYARGFAQYHQAKLSAIYALPVPLGVYDLESWREVDRQWEIQARERMKEYCEEDITPFFARGPGIPEQIVANAKEGSFDLILMPTHGYRGLKKIFVGSTFQGVLLRSPIPVLALPIKIFEQGKTKFKTPAVILCPIDLREGSGLLVQTTQKLAEIYGAAFTISHSIDLDHNLLRMISLNAFTNFKSEVKTKILKEIQGANHAREIVVGQGAAHENISICADQDSIDLVVLGFSPSSKSRIRTVLYRTVAELSVPALCVPID